jgi:hypothetical protein
MTWRLMLLRLRDVVSGCHESASVITFNTGLTL